MVLLHILNSFPQRGRDKRFKMQFRAFPKLLLWEMYVAAAPPDREIQTQQYWWLFAICYNILSALHQILVLQPVSFLSHAFCAKNCSQTKRGLFLLSPDFLLVSATEKVQRGTAFSPSLFQFHSAQQVFSFLRKGMKK